VDLSLRSTWLLFNPTPVLKYPTWWKCCWLHNIGNNFKTRLQDSPNFALGDMYFIIHINKPSSAPLLRLWWHLRYPWPSVNASGGILITIGPLSPPLVAYVLPLALCQRLWWHMCYPWPSVYSSGGICVTLGPLSTPLAAYVLPLALCLRLWWHTCYPWHSISKSFTFSTNNTK
jgi:hypothetical protein